jgi:hypothetical protein
VTKRDIINDIISLKPFLWAGFGLRQQRQTYPLPTITESSASDSLSIAHRPSKRFCFFIDQASGFVSLWCLNSPTNQIPKRIL